MKKAKSRKTIRTKRQSTPRKSRKDRRHHPATAAATAAGLPPDVANRMLTVDRLAFTEGLGAIGAIFRDLVRQIGAIMRGEQTEPPSREELTRTFTAALLKPLEAVQTDRGPLGIRLREMIQEEHGLWPDAPVTAEQEG